MATNFVVFVFCSILSCFSMFVRCFRAPTWKCDNSRLSSAVRQQRAVLGCAENVSWKTSSNPVHWLRRWRIAWLPKRCRLCEITAQNMSLICFLEIFHDLRDWLQIFDGAVDSGDDNLVGFDCGNFSISTFITRDSIFVSTNSILSVLLVTDGDVTRPGIRFNYSIGVYSVWSILKQSWITIMYLNIL